MTKTYILERVPGAAETVKWTDICHSREPFYAISHNELVDLGKWDCKQTDRVFVVTRYSRSRAGLCSFKIGRYKTLNAAIRSANRDKELMA